MKTILYLCLQTLFFIGSGFGQATISFTYSLPEDARTSAGVFDSTGALIRTLWSNRSQHAGPGSGIWDGNTDSGSVPSTGDQTYTIKVLRSNVAYDWDGVIGNTEGAWTDSFSTWDRTGYVPTQIRLAFVGTTAWVAPGYSEGTSNLFSFNLSTPNSPVITNKAYVSQNVQFTDVDTDGSFLYMPNAQVWGGENFVTKFTVLGAPASFTDGMSVVSPYSWKNIAMNAVAVTSSSTALPNSIAVQNTGNILAVGYSGNNTVIFFDKTTGAAIGAPLKVAKPTSMGFTSAGLWVLSDKTVYLVKGPSTTNTLTTPLKGLSSPTYLATNKRLNTVVVLDGGAAQQAKEFNSRYVITRIYGDTGGYTDWNPSITNSRLMLDKTASTGAPTANGSWVKVDQSDGLWICDGGNDSRILHIDGANRYVNQIIFGQETYSVGTSQTQPTRVFKGGIEFAIDYSKPLLPGDPMGQGGNGSWRMVKNWTVGAEGANGSTAQTFDTRGGIFYSEQLSNGRVYGYVHTVLSNGGKWASVEFELPAHGPMRFTGNSFPAHVGYEMELDGSVIQLAKSGSGAHSVVKFMRAPLTGFDTSGNPMRGSYVLMASATYDNSSEPNPAVAGWGGPFSFQQTASGVYPVYQPGPFNSVASTGFPHLAGVAPGRSSYLFHANPEKCIARTDFAGNFPCANSFGAHNGNNVMAIGSSIFTGYDGQYAIYGNTYYHYYQDGLMIGQYGQRSIVPPGGYLVQGAAGNIAQIRWVPYNGDVYMYMSSESQLTPIQRWHISNLNSIHEVIGSGVLGSTINLH